MRRMIQNNVYYYSKILCVVFFSYCLINLRINAGKTRQWYYENWCPQGEPCMYYVGSVWDYVFLTSSSFHDGWTLLHVGLISSLLLLMIILLIEIADVTIRRVI